MTQNTTGPSQPQNLKIDLAVAFADSFAWRESFVSIATIIAAGHPYRSVSCRLEHVRRGCGHIGHLVFETLQDVSANLVSPDGLWIEWSRKHTLVQLQLWSSARIGLLADENPFQGPSESERVSQR